MKESIRIIKLLQYKQHRLSLKCSTNIIFFSDEKNILKTFIAFPYRYWHTIF